MRFRKLQIAWSVVCGIACVLLIALWVRSYWWVDQILGPVFGKRFAAGSMPGALVMGISSDRPISWRLGSNHSDEWLRLGDYPSRIWGMFHFEHFSFVAPYWFLILLTAAIAAAPWLRWPKRFSLRTLLIAMTLVAVVLGLIVALYKTS
jgi:hypothetical protein